MVKTILYPPVFGAYTELFAGLAPDAVGATEKGKWVIPWGRIGTHRKDYAEGTTMRQFWEWSEKEVAHYE